MVHNVYPLTLHQWPIVVFFIFTEMNALNVNQDSH